VATGGLAELVYGESKTIEIFNPLLTLEGLRIIYDRNRTETTFPEARQKR
jgi:type III pantothenate kinase